MIRSGRFSFVLTLLACAWLLWLIPAAAIVPFGSEVTETSTGIVTHSSPTLVETDGMRVLWLMAFPAVLGLIAWAGLHRKCTGRASADARMAWFPISLLLGFSILGGFSVGLFVLPAALVLVVAGALTPSPEA
jgi:hypothetical protein